MVKMFFILFGVLAFCQAVCGQSVSKVWVADRKDGTYMNPVLHADYSDPDVCAAGDDFYMTASSFNCIPGLPILHSRDLVNWSLVNYALPVQEPKEFFDKAQHGKGVWAPAIRFHKGEFYIYWGDPDYGIYMIKTRDPKGSWSKPVLVKAGKGMIDPTPLWDEDGKVYLIHAYAGSRSGVNSILVICELNAEGTEVISDPVMVFDGNDGKNHTVEGPKLYKRNGYYYIFAPAGGVATGWQLVLRSKNIYGPYEHKLIMNDWSSYPENGLHQGGMVQLKNGDWWFMIMQDRGPIGRVPCLVPVKWIDGWPMLGDEGKDLITYPKPATGKKSKIKSPATTDEFNASQLGLQWQWNHNPDNSRWSLKERKGYMRLYASQASTLKDARNTLTQRVQGPSCEGSVEMEVTGLKDGNIAGFGIFEFPYAYVAIRQESGRRKIVMCNDGKDIETVEHFNGDKLWIRVRATDKEFKALFYYSLDGVNYKRIGNELQMGLGLPWTANRFALFNFNTTPQGNNGYADFNWFRFTNK